MILNNIYPLQLIEKPKSSKNLFFSEYVSLQKHSICLQFSEIALCTFCAGQRFLFTQVHTMKPWSVSDDLNSIGLYLTPIVKSLSGLSSPNKWDYEMFSLINGHIIILSEVALQYAASNMRRWLFDTS